MRDAFAAIERSERFGDAGDLPLVYIEVGHDGLGCEKRAGAAGRLGEFLKARFRLLIQSNRKRVRAHMYTV